MTVEQLELIPAPVHLTDRQQAILAALTAAGHDGLDAEEAGAILHGFKEGRWAHPRAETCAYCHRDGDTYLKRLRDLGLAKYRRARGDRPGAWIATSATEPSDTVARGMLTNDQPIPF